MTVYFILLLFTALIAYFFGCFDTVVLASRFVFHRNLYRLGRGNILISNFRRIYGWGGVARVLLTELVRDIVPILLGGLLLGIKGHPEVGRVFAGFCLTVGRMYSLFYNMKGSSASICVILTGLFIEPSAGIVAAVVVLAVTWFSRYLALGTVAGAAILAIVTAILTDDGVIIRLAVYLFLMVTVRHIPAFGRIVNGKEERLSFRDDLTYKLDG